MKIYFNLSKLVICLKGIKNKEALPNNQCNEVENRKVRIKSKDR